MPKIHRLASGVIAENRRARFDYEVLEAFEGGIQLTGQEVKSTQAGRADITAAFVTLRTSPRTGGTELWLTNTAIPPWQPKNAPPDYDERRPRKLLLHRGEIAALIGKLQTGGLTAVPLRLYTKGRRVKAEIALVRRRKKGDRRDIIKKREAEREMRRALKM
ncbi:MAG: SsrA-binding protein [Candidatus Terrybacteria bacterium RIFCSPLOWO2_01_FULL_58_14]|uniref:SsrA-binding protein n=2 Tax=Candidatus Terryibacteriota TaxID=1817920 RepID=A0A1G2Q0E9_9BACT|nr:MAG: SsrA-binding protein [Candidatus Terrybacteria bacterium RIFCSPHIGHO2_01_FULL_58_15]OHA54045.1 MAG: SsrA-binding protein [Candidatus Terrybacteria bacterium RIFCSPLOWO2_01_FULL_58_14]